MNNKCTYFISVFVSFLLIVFTSNGQITFQKSYGGTNYDNGYSVKQTYDNGYIVTGFTKSYGTEQYSYVYLVKTDAYGDTLWTKVFGGSGGNWSGNSVDQTTDSGYIIAGIYADSSNIFYVLLIRTDSNGDTLWTKTYGGTNDYDEGGASVQQTKDGGYIITGTTLNIDSSNDAMYLVKTNAIGDTLWTKSYNINGNANGLSIQQTFDGGYIIAGEVDSSVYNNVLVVKTDSLGNMLWTSALGDSLGNSAGNSVWQTKDSGFVIGGYTTSASGNNYVYLIKMQSNGDTLWTKSYSGRGYDLGQSVQQTTDGGFIIAGGTSTNSIDDSVYVIKTDSQGDTLWTKAYSGANDSYANSVQQTTDGGYIIFGNEVNSDNSVNFYLIKTDSSGNVPCGVVDVPTVVIAPSCQVATPATTIGTNTSLSPIYPMVASFGAVTNLCLPTGIKEAIATNSFSIYPNPATDQLYIKSNQMTGASTVTVFNVLGEVLLARSFVDGGVEQVDISAFSPGIYFVKVANGNKEWIAKFVKE